MDMDIDDVEYTNSHRAFLQAFLARGSMTFAEIRPILAACVSAQDPEDRETLPNDITETELSNYIATINSTISPFDLEFRSTLSQHDKTRIYALVNTTSDAITQLATIHSPDEIAYVKRVLDEMFISGCSRRQELFAVQGIKAVNCRTVHKGRQSGVNGHNNTTIINSDDEDGAPAQTQTAGQAQSITMHQAEVLLETLVEEGWFECSRRKHYSLAPRALMELRGWLIETYNEDADAEGDDDEDEGVQRIKFCNACRDIVTIGQRCPDLNCLGRLHDHCTRTMWRSQGGAEKCPVCKKDWEGFAFVGERAAGNQRRSTNGTSSHGGQADEGAEEDEEEEGSDEG